MKIKGTTIVISGAASGMGRATATHLQSLGANIIMLDVNQEAVQSLAQHLNTRAYHCDVTDEANIAHVFSENAEAFAAPAVLVNCAGIIHAKRVLGKHGVMPLAEFRRVLDVNLIGTFNMVRSFAERISMSEATADGERGVIINTASVAAFEGQVGQAAYSASKAGIVGMTLPIARELGAFGIRVMTIAPGIMETPMLEGMRDDVRERLNREIAFPKRLGKPHEFAMLVQHIIENPYLNASVIRLDGGIRMPLG